MEITSLTSGAFSEMLQTAAGKMISAVYLVAVTCLFKHASGFTPTGCDPMVHAYHKLERAEEIIKSAKEKVSNNMESSLPLDCEDLFKNGEKNSGVYSVWPKNRIFAGSISVYCDMDTDGGGWTVIQRRGDFGHSEDYFYRDWQAYKEGFGNLEEDFWLGNDKIFALSNQKLYSARFDLGDVEENKRYAVYDTFWIDNEENNYTLHITGYRGNAGDALAVHNGEKFSTKDRDNDGSERNCAVSFKGAWWYHNCHQSNLNGEYRPGKIEDRAQGLIWYRWKDFYESLATTEIKIRKKSILNKMN